MFVANGFRVLQSNNLHFNVDCIFSVSEFPLNVGRKWRTQKFNGMLRKKQILSKREHEVDLLCLAFLFYSWWFRKKAVLYEMKQKTYFLHCRMVRLG